MSGKTRTIAGAVAYVCDADGPKLDGERAAVDIVGDALRDFVRESNRGRHVWFLADLDELAAKLA